MMGLHTSRQRGHNRRTAFAAITATTAALFAASISPAEADTTFISPFPRDNVYRVFVFGDAYGPGLFQGLRTGMKVDTDVRVENHAVANSRLARPRPVNWPALIKKKADATPFDIAVLTFGVSDRVSMRVDGRRVAVGTPAWRDAYRNRVAATIRAARSGNAAVYWLGLPVMRGPRTNADTRTINAIAREQVFRLGGKYIDTSDGFSTADGSFSPYGPDLSGQTRRLRTKDGVYMTGRGYRKFAHYVERLIRRDLTIARAERDVPLAGDVNEQAQVHRLAKRGTRSDSTETAAARRSEAARRRDQNARAMAAAGDHKAEHATVRVTLPAKSGASNSRRVVQLRIVRPPLPAVVVGHIRRRGSRATSARLGRNLIGISPKDGAGYVNSIASGLDASGNAFASRVSVTQSPYYRALIKGETLRPRAGRTDDFTWPPQDRAPLPSNPGS